jgi:hypothetical protein
MTVQDYTGDSHYIHFCSLYFCIYSFIQCNEEYHYLLGSQSRSCPACQWVSWADSLTFSFILTQPVTSYPSSTVFTIHSMHFLFDIFSTFSSFSNATHAYNGSHPYLKQLLLPCYLHQIGIYISEILIIQWLSYTTNYKSLRLGM